MATEVREEERRRKGSIQVMIHLTLRIINPFKASFSAPTTPTDATFPSPNPNLNKRKRAVSFADPSSSHFSSPAVSPSTKQLRTALNSVAVSRSMSDAGSTITLRIWWLYTKRQSSSATYSREWRGFRGFAPEISAGFRILLYVPPMRLLLCIPFVVVLLLLVAFDTGVVGVWELD
ncbi:hypothetical protein F5877DRAFT_84116 [Lentinula edodes]|nr:hypothetical protein F5877DRAFT_84116 [Lentinula edodes]